MNKWVSKWIDVWIENEQFKFVVPILVSFTPYYIEKFFCD